LSGHLAVGGSGATAAEPEGDLPVGGPDRRLPGPDAAGRDPRGRLRQGMEPRAEGSAAELPPERGAAPPPAARRVVAEARPGPGSRSGRAATSSPACETRTAGHWTARNGRRCT